MPVARQIAVDLPTPMLPQPAQVHDPAHSGVRSTLRDELGGSPVGLAEVAP